MHTCTGSIVAEHAKTYVYKLHNATELMLQIHIMMESVHEGKRHGTHII